MTDNRPTTQATRAAAALVLLMMLAGQVPAEVFEVSSSANSGPNTLRDAILQANVFSDQDEIEFTVTQVYITTPLPAITNPVQINGLGAVHVTINGGATAGHGLTFDIPADLEEGCVVHNVTIRDFLGSGVFIDAIGVAYVHLKDCTIYNNGSKGVEIYTCKDAEVRDCTISNNWSYGVHVQSGAKGCLVDACVISYNYRSGVYLADGSTGGDKTIVQDCDILLNGYGNGTEDESEYGGVQIWSSGNDVMSNHIYLNDGPGVLLGSSVATDNVVRYNNIFANTGNGIDSAGGQAPPVLERYLLSNINETAKISYTIDATGIPNQTFYVDFYYSDDDGTGAGVGEGAAWLGFDTISSGSSGGILSGEATVSSAYSFDYPAALAGNYTLAENDLVVATVSRSDLGHPNLSEFAEQVAVAENIAGRYVFYNNSSWDDTAAAEAADDDAIAPDKEALLPGQTAEFKHYTSYVNGLNGIMIDIHWTEGPIDDLDYFVFKVGNDNDPSSWATAPTPIEVKVRLGAGVDGSDRVTIIWADGAISGEWLQVTMLANDDTCLNEDDVFYFGNAPGETGDSETDAIVDGTDVEDTRDHPHPFFDPAPIDCDYDFNRDKRGNSIDTLIARNSQTTEETALQLIDP